MSQFTCIYSHINILIIVVVVIVDNAESMMQKKKSVFTQSVGSVSSEKTSDTQTQYKLYSFLGDRVGGGGFLCGFS